MTDLAPLQQRMDQALERIRASIDRCASSIPNDPSENGPSDAETDLQRQLDHARERHEVLSGDLHAAKLEVEAMRMQMELMRDKQDATSQPGDHEEAARLRTELAEERQAVRDLESRVDALKVHIDQRPAARVATPLPDVEELAELEVTLHGLQQSNAELRAANEQLRYALSDQIVDPELINSAMRSELDGLRAARRAETAEISAILDAMVPLIKGDS